MIKFENIKVTGFEEAIRGMRNPMNSWDRSDSIFCELEGFKIGDADHNLMIKLANNGSVHAKYRRMIVVYVDIIAPLYWWKEFDTYKVGTVANSCSSMHMIHVKAFELDDFSHEHLIAACLSSLKRTINELNECRDAYLDDYISKKPERKKAWWQMIQLLPSSYNQRRTVMMNYEVLANIYKHRKNHKLDEWIDMCDWIEKLLYSEIITCEVGE